MRIPLFHATCLAAIEDDFGWIVGLAEQEFGSTHYLRFQRGHSSDAQDQALGLDGYYVEKDDQSNSCYGGIESISLNADAIELKLDETGSQSLNLERHVLITFDADKQTLESFRDGLAAVFAGTGVLCE